MPDLGLTLGQVQFRVNMNTKTRVINDGVSEVQPVINDGISKVPAAFREWANQVREVQAVRGHVRPVGWWWRRLSPELQRYMLTVVCGPDADRYADCDWAAFDANLRGEISRLSRVMVRFLEGCPWR